MNIVNFRKKIIVKLCLALGMVASPLLISASDLSQELDVLEARGRCGCPERTSRVTISFTLDGIPDPEATAVGFAQDKIDFATTRIPIIHEGGTGTLTIKVKDNDSLNFGVLLNSPQGISRPSGVQAPVLATVTTSSGTKTFDLVPETSGAKLDPGTSGVYQAILPAILLP